ncbi:MAG: glycosyltransferase family 4 protein [Candidatus Omnitrophota bacterium]|nr:glycosyltransferase family 4 protein [Candidatus Omnitrophota bacterium]
MIHPHDVNSKLEPWTIRIVNFAKEFASQGLQIKLVYFPLNLDTVNAPYIKDHIEFIPIKRDYGIKALLRNCFNFSKLVDWANVVHFQKCFHYVALPVLLNCWLKNKPVHYDWDDWEEKIYYDSVVSPIKFVGWYLHIFEMTIPKIVDTVSVSSQKLKNLCLSLGVDKNMLFDVHVGADLDRFNPRISGERIKKRYNLNSSTVLYLGQLQGAQYAHLFIKAAKIILDKGIKADFLIVGDGLKLKELKKLAKDLSLDGKIVFTGAVGHNEVPEYIASSDIAVACFEDNEITRCKSPLKIAEYLASGKPIVASDVGEIRKMVDGCAILTASGDANSLSEGIIRLLEDEKLRKNLGDKARKRAEEKYNWKISAKNLLNAYHLVLRNRED